MDQNAAAAVPRSGNLVPAGIVDERFHNDESADIGVAVLVVNGRLIKRPPAVCRQSDCSKGCDDAYHASHCGLKKTDHRSTPSMVCNRMSRPTTAARRPSAGAWPGR